MAAEHGSEVERDHGRHPRGELTVGEGERSVELQFLSPTSLPDLAAIRDFVQGSSYKAMSAAITCALVGGAEVPRQALERARAAAMCLNNDLAALVSAAASAAQVRATMSEFETWGSLGRWELLALALSEGLDEAYNAELWHWIAGHPPDPTEPPPPESPTSGSQALPREPA